MTAPLLASGLRFTVVAALAALVGGCNVVQRMQQIGSPPPMSEVQNPVQQPGYRTVSMPMPAPEPREHLPNSLWRPGAKAFFKDQRAARIGDLVTVQVTIDEKAEVSNTTRRSRTNSEDAGLPRLFGYEASLNRVLPQAVSNTDLLELNSTSNSQGTGTIDREEEITVTLAAVVTQVLPNGNLVVFGRQEIRVNFEIRELLVAGVVRPEDISSANTIRHTQIAELRVSYGGRGQLSDVQQPRFGQQLLDIILPF